MFACTRRSGQAPADCIVGGLFHQSLAVYYDRIGYRVARYGVLVVESEELGCERCGYGVEQLAVVQLVVVEHYRSLLGLAQVDDITHEYV